MPTKAPTYSVTPRRRTVDTRPSSCARGYDVAWRNFRAWYAACHPAICTACGYAGIGRKMHLDHIKPIAQGGARLDEGNVQWLCDRCHSSKTATEDGGFGRSVTPALPLTDG